MFQKFTLKLPWFDILTDDFISGTDGPKLGAWTSINQYTEAEDLIAPMSKSTRHVVSESKSIYYTPRMPPKQSLNRNGGDYDINEMNAGKAKGKYTVSMNQKLFAIGFSNFAENHKFLIHS